MKKQIINPKYKNSELANMFLRLTNSQCQAANKQENLKSFEEYVLNEYSSNRDKNKYAIKIKNNVQLIEKRSKSLKSKIAIAACSVILLTGVTAGAVFSTVASKINANPLELKTAGIVAEEDGNVSHNAVFVERKAGTVKYNVKLKQKYNGNQMLQEKIIYVDNKTTAALPAKKEFDRIKFDFVTYPSTIQVWAYDKDNKIIGYVKRELSDSTKIKDFKSIESSVKR